MQSSIKPETFEKIKDHVSFVKGFLEGKKKNIVDKIQKQLRNFKGQKKLFKKLDENPLIEIRTTPLKQADCEIYQKGVDGKLVTDLVHLAHTESYDIALVLGGDTDIIEAIKLVRDNLSKTVVIVACYDKQNPECTNVSDLKSKCDYFMNLHDYKDELFELFEELRKKED